MDVDMNVPMDPWLTEQCKSIMESVMHKPIASLFLDQDTLLSLFKHKRNMMPSSLKTLLGNLNKGKYHKLRDWYSDVKKLWVNIEAVFGSVNVVTDCAGQIQYLFDNRINKMVFTDPSNWSAQARRYHEELEYLMTVPPSQVKSAFFDEEKEYRHPFLKIKKENPAKVKAMVNNPFPDTSHPLLKRALTGKAETHTGKAVTYEEHSSPVVERVDFDFDLDVHEPKLQPKSEFTLETFEIYRRDGIEAASKSDVEKFLIASPLLCEYRDIRSMTSLIKRNQPELVVGKEDVTINIDLISAPTLSLLSQYAKYRYQQMGIPYPE